MNDTLIEALATWLGANQSITALFPGGVWNTTAADGAALPYLTLQIADSQPTGVIGRNVWVDKVTINFEVRTTLGAPTEELVEALRIALFTTPIQSLQWSHGQECGRFLKAGEAGELEEGLGPGGTDVWVQRLPIGFTITRTL